MPMFGDLRGYLAADFICDESALNFSNEFVSLSWKPVELLPEMRACERKVQGGTSYPGPGLRGPGLKGPGRVQVSALSFGIAP